MRIVDRATFLTLPVGTVFAKFEPHAFGEAMIKGETTGPDFYVQGLVPWFEGAEDSEQYFAVLDRMISGDASPALDWHCEARDGLYDADQLFAVFSPADLDGMIARLQEARAALT